MKEQITHNRYLTTQQAAELMNLNPTTLAKWRMNGEGPRYTVAGKRSIRYRESDVEKFMNPESSRHGETRR